MKKKTFELNNYRNFVSSIIDITTDRGCPDSSIKEIWFTELTDLVQGADFSITQNFRFSETNSIKKKGKTLFCKYKDETCKDKTLFKAVVRVLSQTTLKINLHVSLSNESFFQNFLFKTTLCWNATLTASLNSSFYCWNIFYHEEGTGQRKESFSQSWMFEIQSWTFGRSGHYEIPDRFSWNLYSILRYIWFIVTHLHFILLFL